MNRGAETGMKQMNEDNDNNGKLLKKELLDLFQKYGYISDGKDCEIKIRTTSGKIAWISISSMETIK